MLRPMTSIPMRIVLAGALAAATLAGCGRKGPMELPPSAQVMPPDIDPATGEPRAILSPDGYPVAPSGEKKPIALDWLID